MIRQLNTVFCIIFTFLLSCTEKENNKFVNDVVHIESSYINGKKLVYSDSLIHQNQEENTIGAVASIYYWNEYFLVSDYMNKCLHVLDTNMNYIKRIGQEGRGPGEFTSAPVIVKESNKTLKLIKVLEKKACLYNKDLSFWEEIDLPQELNYQFRLPLQIDNVIILSIGYPGSLADIKYYSEHGSLAVINSQSWKHEKDIFSFDPIYHDERYSGYTGSYFGVILSLINNGEILAIQRASNLLTILDNNFNQKIKFGIDSKYYKQPQQKTLQEVQQSYDSFVDFGTKNTLITNLHYDKNKQWYLISFINKSKDAYLSRDKTHGLKFIQVYDSEFNCIFDEIIEGVFLFSKNGKIHILEEESPERLVIVKYKLVGKQ